VFAINTDGTGFTNLYSFSGGSDGANPYGVIISGSVLYGTTDGGPNGGDTIFQLNTDGTGFSTLYVFNADSDGSYPGGLILSGSTLFGFTQFRGPGANGTVFAVNSDGTAFTTLYSFTGGGDGSRPLGTLSLAGGVLYGATVWGGVDGIPPGGPGANGTLFALNADGTGFTVLRSFTNTATDGGAPNGLILFGNTLYGTACCGSLGAWNGVRR
jgi:hypothetical protein